MKIAMIGQKGIPATYGGVERHVEELSARLAAMGHEVTAYCRRHYTPEMDEHRSVRLRILPSINTRHLDALSHTTLAVADALRRGFDIIHFHAIGPASLAFIPRILAGRRTAVVATLHGLDWQRRKWGTIARCYLRFGAQIAVRFPHRTISVSRRMVEYFGARGKNLIHIPNGVESAEPTPIKELAEFGLGEKKFLLWMGRFVPEKRVEDLIRAFRALPTENTLLLAGEIDESDPYFKSLRTAAGDDKRIVFSGGLYDRARAEALSNAELMVLPSELEGFPIALLEAMRYARPVLAGDIPENLEAIEPDVNGFTFNMGNVDSLRERIFWILSHPDQARSAGVRAATDSEQYDWNVIARRTEIVYQEAVTARGRPKPDN